MNLLKLYVLGGALVVVGLAVALTVEAQSMGQHGQAPLGTQIAEQSTRACVYPVGGAVTINCSNAAAASSAQLVAWARYVMQCGDDSYWATGAAATGADADANDLWLPEGAYMDFFTTSSVRYMSCLNKTEDSDCRIVRCM